MKENKQLWVNILGYPNYDLREDGLVKNIKTGRILKQCDNSSGYRTLNLYNNGKRRSVSAHVLVAENFCDGYKPGLEVNHKDGNKHNNHYSNLEWETRGGNQSHAYKAGLNYGPKHRPVRVIETGEVFPSIKDCARSIGGHDRNISRCLSGNAKSYRSLTFEEADRADVNTRSVFSTKANKIAERKCKIRPIRVIETGNIYPTISACAEDIGGDPGTISACLHGKHHSHKGYHFEYAG